VHNILSDNAEPRAAILVDCDNVPPEILEYALLKTAQFGRIVLRRGYGNQATLANKWQDALVDKAFTPCLQYQFVSGKNTSDMALALDALEALFNKRVNIFCLVTSDSDFTYLCRKLRELDAAVYIVGEAKTPVALRSACDQFFEWKKRTAVKEELVEKSSVGSSKIPEKQDVIDKDRPAFLVEAVSQLASDTSEEKILLTTLGQYLKRAYPEFSPKNYNHSSLLKMVRTYDLLIVEEEGTIHWISLAAKAE
jgi:uncharacterized protein (TIGR00288 family)